MASEVSNSTIRASAEAVASPNDPGNSAGTPNARVLSMGERWGLVAALLGGTPTMRAAGQAYLPKEPGEGADAYSNRLSRTTLFNGFKKAVLNLTGRVFAKPVTFGEDVPTTLEYLEEDADRLGNHLNVFARKVFEDGVGHGLSYILVDMPPALPEGSTLADEKAAQQRPYFVHIKAPQIIGWRTEMHGGRLVLTQLRITEEGEKPVGNFGTKTVTRIRVLEPGKWSVYEQNEKKEWVVVEDGTTTLKKIPLVVFYTGFDGFMCASPPLMDLAHLNVQHWQSASDQRHILHVARVPLLFGAGLSAIGTEGDVTIGPDNLIKGPIGSTLTYVEHNGAAIKSGLEDIQKLEDQMAMMGLEPVMPRSGAGAPTATGRVIDSVENASLLQQWAIGLGDTIEQALMIAAEWLGESTEEAGSVQVNTDLAFSLRDAQDLQTLLQSRLNGEITRDTFWKELQRRGVLSETFDAEVESSALDEESAAELERTIETMKAAGAPKPGEEGGGGPPTPPKAPGTNLGGGA